MPYKFLLLSLCFIFSACSTSKKVVVQETATSYESEIQQFQDELNEFYSDKKESPLEAKQIKIFKRNKGHNFFEVDESFKVVADFNTDIEKQTFEFKTSTERLAVYELFGIATFQLQGQPFKLNVYQNVRLRDQEEYKDYLFLPFTDLTSGDSSYGGGRYIDLSIPSGNTIVIDFNKAYNPYCAYSDKYSCPVPPADNFVDFEIKAGVKVFEALERK